MSNRDCCAGRVVSKESAGRQVGEIAPASTEEPRECFDWWWQPAVDCSWELGFEQEERVQRVAHRSAARRQKTTSKEPTRERIRCFLVPISLLYPEWGEKELFFGTRSQEWVCSRKPKRAGRARPLQNSCVGLAVGGGVGGDFAGEGAVDVGEVDGG
jgi:hypothetical protein